jgi:hypothetical protein
LGAKVRRDFTELFESGLEGLDDFLGDDIRFGEIVGFFEAFVCEPEDVETGLSRLKKQPDLILPLKQILTSLIKVIEFTRKERR